MKDHQRVLRACILTYAPAQEKRPKGYSATSSFHDLISVFPYDYPMKTILITGAMIITSLLPSACDKDTYKRLDLGHAAPNFRLRVVLDTPSSRADLHTHFAAIAAENNFSQSLNIDSKDLPENEKYLPRSFIWKRHPPQAYRLVFVLSKRELIEQPDPGVFHERFDVIVYHYELTSLSLAQWKLFAKFDQEILRARFPAATVTVIKHPKLFTDPAYWDEYANAAGVSLPD